MKIALNDDIDDDARREGKSNRASPAPQCPVFGKMKTTATVGEVWRKIRRGAESAFQQATRIMTDTADDYWRIYKRIFRRRLNWLSILIIFGSVLWLGMTFVPRAHERYALRMYASYLVMRTDELKALIAEQLKANPQASIDPELAEKISSDLWFPGQCNAPESYVEYGYEPRYACIRIDDKAVLHDGTIIVYSQHLKAMATLRPQVTENTVEWTCRLVSELGDIAPQRCKF
jgi:hypothetical protein